MQTFYTLRIEYGSSMQPDIMEFKNLLHPPDIDLHAWAKSVRTKLFTGGFQYTAEPGKIRFVHPMYVCGAWLIRQKNKQ